MTERIYSNDGNRPLIDMMIGDCRRLLDVGCGTGDNVFLIKAKNPECVAFGVTHAIAEAEIAKRRMADCWVFDIEQELPVEVKDHLFDTMIFSHVLEHLRDPAEALARFSQLLCSGGQVLIAVPNVLSWKMRIQFLRGKFEYESAGVLDDTHLRFFTYFTAAKYLLSKSEFDVTRYEVSGSVPLWWLRRFVLPKAWCERIDQWGCRFWPNLFGGQILIRAVKR